MYKVVVCFRVMEYKCTRWLYVSDVEYKCTRWLYVSDDGV